MRKKFVSYGMWLIAFIAGGLLAGCEHELPLDPDRPALNATFASLQANIFTPKCAITGCHAGRAPKAGMNLSAGQAYENLVDQQSQFGPPRVAPGDVENSVLYLKVSGTVAGARMPRGGPPLSQEEINAIRDWIAAGALNN